MRQWSERTGPRTTARGRHAERVTNSLPLGDSVVTGAGKVYVMRRTAVLVLVLAVATLLAGCGEDGVETQATRDTIAEASEDAREAAESAFAELRTGAERLVDELRTRNAPDVKEQLLGRCRDALERLRKADSDAAARVDRLCNRIRETDVSDSAAWSEIKAEIENLK